MSLRVASLWLVVSCLAVGAVACGRTAPEQRFESLAPLLVEAGVDAGQVPECIENGECDDESVCIDERCVFFGACLLDQHCPGPLTCDDNVCVGDLGPIGPPLPCEINADCGENHYCIDGRCRRGTECLKHAHCPAANACLREICVSAVEVLTQ